MAEFGEQFESFVECQSRVNFVSKGRDANGKKSLQRRGDAENWIFVILESITLRLRASAVKSH